MLGWHHYGVISNIIFLQKNKHTRLTYFTIKVTNSQRKDVSLYAYYWLYWIFT